MGRRSVELEYLRDLSLARMFRHTVAPAPDRDRLPAAQQSAADVFRPDLRVRPYEVGQKGGALRIVNDLDQHPA